MAHNKFASAHVNQADAILIHTVLKTQAPAFSIFPQADEFENAKQYLEALARAFDEVAYQVASDADSNSTGNVSTRDRLSIFSDALNDSGLLSDLDEAAYELREDQRTVLLERAQ